MWWMWRQTATQTAENEQNAKTKRQTYFWVQFWVFRELPRNPANSRERKNWQNRATRELPRNPAKSRERIFVSFARAQGWRVQMTQF